MVTSHAEIVEDKFDSGDKRYVLIGKGLAASPALASGRRVGLGWYWVSSSDPSVCDTAPQENKTIATW